MEIKKQIEMMFKEKQQAAVVPQPPKINNRTGANYFVCNFEGCGATIKHRRNLVRHWQLHQKAKYYCYICGFQSMNREQITQHHCDPNLPKFDCDECDKKFTVLQHLNRHLLLIHGIRLFVWCSSCRSYFARIDALKKHQSRCHQTDNNMTNNSLLNSSGQQTNHHRNESSRSIASSTIPTTSASKNKNLIMSNDNNADRIINSVISSQNSNGQLLVGTSNSRRDENHHFMSISNKQPSIIGLSSQAINSQSTPNNGQNNIDENLFRTQNALINKTPILSLDNSAVVGNAFANNLALVRNSVISSSRSGQNIELLNSNITMLGNNKVQQYMTTSVNNERDVHNPFEAIREDYLYRNKKIRFGELTMDKDRIFKN